MDHFEGKSLRQLTEADLLGLIQRAMPESSSLDYKESFSINTEGEKRDFLADLTAFANVDGGMIICGITDRRENTLPTGIPGALVGFELSNPDASQRLIDALARDCIEERLPGLETHFVPLNTGKFALVIRIPASPRAPHMVVIGKERRFYRRANAGNEPMTTGQIRDAVLRTDAFESRTTAFVEKRLGLLHGSGNVPYWAVHVIPLFGNQNSLDLSSQKTIDLLNRVPVASSTIQGNRFHCLEGFKAAVGGHDGPAKHTLVFRNGSIEAFGLIRAMKSEGGSFPRFAPLVVHREVKEWFNALMPLCAAGLSSPPAAVFLSLDNLGNYPILIPGDYWPAEEAHIMPDGPILAGHRVINDFTPNPDEVFKPMLDVVWQAGGFPRCPAYDESGKFVDYAGMSQRLY